MKLIERNHCVFTGREDLELLYSFKGFPVFMGCVDHPHEKDSVADLNLWISRSTGSVQLNPLIPLDILYQASHGSGSVGKLWMKHHQQLAQCLAPLECQSVLDIGGGHGVLAQCFQKLQKNFFWTIVEPNPTVEETDKLHVIRSVFDSSFEITVQYDAVVHSHVFEHVYEPGRFLWQLRGFIKDGGYLVFSVPNLEAQFRKGITYVLGFEHTIFLTEIWIEFLLATNGYVINDKRYFSEDHSIFYCTQKQDCEEPIEIEPPKQYDSLKKAFEEYIQSHIEMVTKINDGLKATSLPVYLFGGHISSQYLFAYGLQSNGIVCILDNDKNKHSKRLYGTDLIVNSPDMLRDQGEVVVILRQGVFNDEIKKGILEKINPQAIFWE